MKSKYNYILYLTILLAVVGTLWSCSEDDSDSTGGTPRVDYVRVTDPDSSDSLVLIAGQGQMIAIIGENLQDVTQIWFNDQQASLDPSFITSNSVITRVPTKIPTEINHLLTMYFGHGDSLKIPFVVLISAPRIDRLKSDYVSEGDIAVLYGDYFYEPLTVTFSGDVEGEVLSVEDDQIEVRVPVGAQAGPVTVTTNFGERESSAWFMDNRNIVASFDGTFDGMWRGTDFVVSTDGSIPNVSGNFIRINRGDLSAWPYLEIYGGPSTSDTRLETRNIPQDAFDNPDDYSVKFEINSVDAFVGPTMRLFLGDESDFAGDFGATRNALFYEWNANQDTKGEWETVSIPWADVYEANASFDYNASGYGMYIYFHGPNPGTYNVGLDNFRVVPN